ncbi:hypothetical protein N658DRAFT_511522 [Parathielavia hyrcaniae]|uniref:Uncharacterized protein n=1 Tax=Parathielavia hyrcaniae TaxID=113614 RepID=A0AAN6SX46_9PEZI|nr:hypothetical protein N658DRAFT_511522 [Parathielavia hyrcaniae]
MDRSLAAGCIEWEVSANKEEAVDVVLAQFPAEDTAIAAYPGQDANKSGVKGEAGAVTTNLQGFSCTIKETSATVQVCPVTAEDGTVGAQTPTPDTVSNPVGDVHLDHDVTESPALESTTAPVVPAGSCIPEKAIGTNASCVVDAKDDWEAVEATNLVEEDRPESSARNTTRRIQYSVGQLLSLRHAAVNPRDWFASIPDLPKPTARAPHPLISTPEHAAEDLHTDSQENACKQAEAIPDKAAEAFKHAGARESLLVGAMRELEARADKAAETLKRVKERERSLLQSLKDSEERAAKVAEALRSAEDRERGLAHSLKDSEKRADRLAEALRRAEDREVKFTKALEEHEERAPQNCQGS